MTEIIIGGETSKIAIQAEEISREEMQKIKQDKFCDHIDERGYFTGEEYY